MTSGLILGLHAAIVAVTSEEPRVLTVPDGSGVDPGIALPFGPLEPDRHRTLERGLRAWVREQTGMELPYVEQLYTFADRDRGFDGDDLAKLPNIERKERLEALLASIRRIDNRLEEGGKSAGILLDRAWLFDKIGLADLAIGDADTLLKRVAAEQGIDCTAEQVTLELGTKRSPDDQVITVTDAPIRISAGKKNHGLLNPA